MRFEARELKPSAEPVTASTLREGEVYFSVQFADDDMSIPIVETFVFVGVNLDADLDADMDADGAGGDRFYFQDAASYLDGRPWDADDDDVSLFVQPVENLSHIFEYEQALEELMKCSLRRRKISG